MKLLILQNSDFEKPGILLDWARERKIPWELVRAFEQEVESAGEFTHLILLGSPHSVSEMASLPWLQAEARIAAEFITQGRRLLGICLGAQLLAHLLGGKISLGPKAEIGWHLVDQTGDLAPAVLFQWHREIFSLPPGAVPFGRSAATPLQGFWKDDKILALAGHPEINESLVKDYIHRCWSEEWFDAEVKAGRGGFIQRPEEMMQEAQNRVEQSRAAVFAWLDRWAAIRNNDND